MKKNLITAVFMTIATTVLLGILYPLLVTGIAQLIFPKQANGQLIQGSDGVVVGSRLIGQPFSGPSYFHSRPSSAGAAGYDATASGGSNLGPTNAQLIARVNGDVAKLQAENPGAAIPVDLVTTSGSGLDPDITPAAAQFQSRRVAEERKIPETEVARLVVENSQNRQWGFLGEPRVNVLELNIALDTKYGRPH
ncbi:MAG TPA: potassium-transporting ATPase subunit KdpC [Terriglobales bacterium]|jgi:K+-transporting ATPase ATPase C chain|nr:potassium-transporting ATPase subunit KdpC [Terriglobales bacterium]